MKVLQGFLICVCGIVAIIVDETIAGAILLVGGSIVVYMPDK